MNKKRWFVIIALAIVAVLGVLLYAFIQSLALPTLEEAGLRYRTTQAIPIPDDVDWGSIGFAKELIHQPESMVVVDGGPNPVPDQEWDDFKPRFPWSKNIDRNILFQKTFFIRSPYAPMDCSGSNCLIIREYKDYTWLELAQPAAVDYIPGETNFLKPDPGYLVVKVIRKCQFLQFEDGFYRLTDGRGNFYAMHATETGEPTTEVVLPPGWTVKRIDFVQPLTLSPFGSDGECYFNMVGDHLGQGYHQYIYAAETYPE